MRLERLKRRGDFIRIARGRLSKRLPAVCIQWAIGNQVRVGFTASKRNVSPKAVLRNRAKRRLRAWVDQNLLRTAHNVCGDFVFIATPLTAIIPYAQLAEQCEEAVRQCIKRNRPSLP